MLNITGAVAIFYGS